MEGAAGGFGPAVDGPGTVFQKSAVFVGVVAYALGEVDYGLVDTSFVGARPGMVFFGFVFVLKLGDGLSGQLHHLLEVGGIFGYARFEPLAELLF